MTTLTFIIPVRHPANSRDWSRLKSNLSQTVGSIAAQTHDDWRGIIVANHGSDLPGLPERFAVEWVDFPPNDLHDKGAQPHEVFLDAFRFDKGRRVLKGMLRARESRFFMIVDDDDFVSNRLTAFVASQRDANGWTVDRGYVWGDGGGVMYAHDDFNHVCGTSLIIRADHYGLPERYEDASPEYVKSMLGGHYSVGRLMAERGTPLASLPFRGAVYRVAQAGSHSQTPTIWRKYFFSADVLRHPKGFLRNLLRLRRVGGQARREFFGVQAGAQNRLSRT